MIKHYLIYILAIFCIIHTSCGFGDSRKNEAIAFVAHIDSVFYETDPPGDAFEHYNITLAREFSEGRRNPIAVGRLDTLRFLFDRYIKAIDKGIEKMQNMTEFDGSCLYLESNLSFLKQSREFWMSSIPKFIHVYERGWENLDASERGEMIQLRVRMNEMQEMMNKSMEEIARKGRQLGGIYRFTYVQGKHR